VVAIDAQTVLDACASWTNDRVAKRNQAFEAEIAAVMKQKRWFGWGRPYTREEAIQYLKTDREYVSTWELISYTYSIQNRHIDVLVAVANVVLNQHELHTKTVELTNDQVYMLSKWL
jgi:hypothetical protein